MSLPGDDLNHAANGASDISLVVERSETARRVDPGMTIYFQPVQDVQIRPNSSRSQYQYTLTGNELAEVVLWAGKLVAEMRRDPLFRDVSSEAQESGLRAALDINRQRAGQLRRQHPGREQYANDAFAQPGFDEYGQANQYRVVLEALPEPSAIRRSFQSSMFPARRAGCPALPPDKCPTPRSPP